MADPATTRLANTVGYVYADDDAYTRFEDEEGRDMVTDAYDASKTYAEGALCINDNKLYKAASAIETAEVWTPDHWTQTDINTELSSLNTKTTALQTQCDSGTVNNATKWNGFTLNASVENTTDTWIPIFHGNEIQHTTQTGIVNLAWHYIDTLTSPSQIKQGGLYAVGTCGSAINDNATSDRKFTEWNLGDFTIFVFAKNAHLSSTKGCQYGTAFITSARSYANFWVAQIWDYQFLRFQKLGS